MHFKNYPHDTQTCRMQIESSEYYVNLYYRQVIQNVIFCIFLYSVSHTTDELVFIWDPQIPLDVDKNIELPQLELISTKNNDCTTEYSTGECF